MDQDDRDIAMLERKLGLNKRSGKAKFLEDTKTENMFELFDCADKIISLQKYLPEFKKGAKEFTSTKGQRKEEVQEDEDDEEEEDEMDGEEEDYEGDEEGYEGDEGEEEGDEGEEEGGNLESSSKAQRPVPGPSLAKRAPEKAEERLKEEAKKQVLELSGLTEVRLKDNKELYTKMNELMAFVGKNKVSAKMLALATFHAIKPQEKVQQQPVKKRTKPASTEERLKLFIYIVYFKPEEYAVEYLRHWFDKVKKDAGKKNDTLYQLGKVLQGFYVFDMVGAKLVLQTLVYMLECKQSELDKAFYLYLLHLFAKQVRRKNPGDFKKVMEEMKKPLINSTNSELKKFVHETLEKLRNNMEIPGQDYFEVSNSAVKLFEKLKKKKASENFTISKDISYFVDGETAKVDINAQTQNKQNFKDNSKDLEDPLAGNEKLMKLADNLTCATQIERRVLKHILESSDYLDVVQKIIEKKTYGSENKEVAYPILQCCLKEKSYNKFYTTIAIKLISLKEEFGFSFQLCIWDEFHDISEDEPKSYIQNLGNFIADLFIAKKLDAKVFKFLNDTPIKTVVAKIAKIIIMRLLLEYTKDQLFLLSNKLKGKGGGRDICGNFRKILKYVEENVDKVQRFESVEDRHEFLEKVRKFCRNCKVSDYEVLDEDKEAVDEEEEE